MPLPMKSQKKKPPKENNPNRPFRGKTPQKVFQTVDIGSGRGDWIKKQAEKFPNRQYMVVDPIYHPSFTSDNYHSVRKVKKWRAELDKPNTTVRGEEFSKTIDFMKKSGYKTRHFNLDMPYLPVGNNTLAKSYSLDKLFVNMQHVLIPNGKIHITSEDPTVLEKTKELAEKHGLSVRPIRAYPGFNSKHLRTKFMRAVSQNVNRDLTRRTAAKGIKRLEITYGSKISKQK